MLTELSLEEQPWWHVMTDMSISSSSLIASPLVQVDWESRMKREKGRCRWRCRNRLSHHIMYLLVINTARYNLEQFYCNSKRAWLNSYIWSYCYLLRSKLQHQQQLQRRWLTSYGWLYLATTAGIILRNYPEKLPWPIPVNLLEEGQLYLVVSHSI